MLELQTFKIGRNTHKKEPVNVWCYTNYPSRYHSKPGFSWNARQSFKNMNVYKILTYRCYRRFTSLRICCGAPRSLSWYNGCSVCTNNETDSPILLSIFSTL